MNDGCASRRRRACVVNTPYILLICKTIYVSLLPVYIVGFTASCINTITTANSDIPTNFIVYDLFCTGYDKYDNIVWQSGISLLSSKNLRDIFCSQRRHFFHFQPVDFETRVVHGLRVRIHVVFNLFDTTYTR